MSECSSNERVVAVSPPISLLRRHRDFRRLWAGETISIFGSRMGDVAVSFAAIIAIGATPLQMGVLASVRLFPKLLLNLIAGVWVDRLRRRPLMIGADLGRCALLATIPIAATLGHLRMGLFYPVILAVGVLDLLFDLAYGAYLPSLVDIDDLVEANSKLSASYAAAEVGGFAFAGWLVQILTAPHAILVDAVSFIASAVAINSIGRVEKPITQGRNLFWFTYIADNANCPLSCPHLSGGEPRETSKTEDFQVELIRDVGYAGTVAWS
jgi:hypothetical protein